MFHFSRPDFKRFKAVVLIGLIFLLVALLWPQPQRSIQVAVAKGGRLVDTAAALETAVNQQQAWQIALTDPEMAALVSSESIDFLYAVRLGAGESARWRDEGCRPDQCAQLTFYDYEQGGTLEAVVDMARERPVAFWRDPHARPGASPTILPRALQIAAADGRVQALLGDINAAEPVMVPMSAWLADDDCRDQWCVDLTFMAPDESGRVLHIFVNMEQQAVSRLFFSRARADRLYKQPAAQGGRYQNGCHNQYDWHICWEMTAHDGINFYEAAFEERTIFSSAKIPQVEAYYPSWPGGYRDEIGYGSSVPPYYGTVINDLGDGFEVRQLYTEFLRWPNCICCYRYEQIMRFYADGSFEPRFISHGPGCDDPSTYRPFWRIDLNLDDAAGETVWYWDLNRWVRAEEELEHDLFERPAPDGAALYTAVGNLRYYWYPEPTDPLGNDSGRIFVLRQREGEGDGPVEPGAADTFRPPQQWIDGESLLGQHVVVWFVPSLKTRKSEPFWCMPDPEPDYSPCEAVLRIALGPPLSQPSAEELAEAGLPTPRPTLTPTPGPTPTPRPIDGREIETLILNAGCGNCHAIGDMGEPNKVGPDLTNIGNVAGRRMPGMTAADYVRQSILEPNAFIAPQCPNGPCLPGIMPADYGARLDNEQLVILLAFLLRQKRDEPVYEEEATPSLPPQVVESGTAVAVPVAEPDGETAERMPESLGVFILALTLGMLLLLIVFAWSRRGRD